MAACHAPRTSDGVPLPAQLVVLAVVVVEVDVGEVVVAAAAIGAKVNRSSSMGALVDFDVDVDKAVDIGPLGGDRLAGWGMPWPSTAKGS